MRYFARLSVRGKLLWLIILASALALLCVLVGVAFYEVRTFRPRALAQLQARAEVLEEVLVAPLDFNLSEMAERSLARHCSDPSMRAAGLYNREALFAAYPAGGGDHWLPPTPRPGGPEFTAQSLSLWQPIRNHEEILLGYLYLVQELPPVGARLPQYVIMAVTVSLALAIVGFTLMRGLRNHILQPLAKLVETTEQVTRRNDYAIRAAVTRDDELGQLAHSFNEMLEAVGQRDAALREASSRIENVFNAATEVAMVATDPHGLVTVFNRGAERLLGYSAEEVVGHLSPAAWHLPEEVNARAEELTRQLGRPVEGFETFVALTRQGESEVREWTMRRKDGSLRVMRLAITAARDARGQLGGFLGVSIDLTGEKRAEAERQQLQAQLIHSQKMEAVGRLAGGVAHDFNNILTAILLGIDLLQEDQRLPPEARQGLRELEMEAKRAASLTRQLLLFSRRQVPQPAVLELNALLGDLTKMLRRLIGEQISIDLQVSAGDLWLEADPSMLEQVVMNLVVNARDAMTNGGAILLATQAVHWDETETRTHPEGRPGDFARLTVRDVGCGMAEAVLKRLFEPFFTTKGPGQGTGLGLATVFGIVKQHHGWIEVESSVGQGSTFTVYLPTLTAAAAGPREAAPPEPPRGRQEVLLLAEDEDAVRSALATRLSHLGYQVETAVHARDALQRYEAMAGRVDLVITDLVMPGGMSGWQLAEELRRRDPQLRIILITGYHTNLADPGMPRLERSRLLHKPFEANTLARFIRELLDHP